MGEDRKFPGGLTVGRTLGFYAAAAALLALAVLSGCALGGGTGLEAAAHPKPGERVVYGRIAAVEGDRALAWMADDPAGGPDGDLNVMVLRKGQRHAATYEIDGDGAFAWALAPGEYVLAGYHWRRFDRRRTDRVWAGFTVPPGDGPVYIGTLRIDIGQLPSPHEVADEMEAATAAFRSLLPEAEGRPVKSLMAHEPPYGGDRATSDICDPRWGFDCGTSWAGPEAVSPGLDASGVPLAPHFAWQPSPAAAVTYDVVVYEGITFDANYDRRELHGPVVRYAEGLARPEYAIADPLEPNRRYFWAVRLRKDGQVSSWSRHGSLGIYVVRISQRSGKLFDFETGG